MATLRIAGRLCLLRPLDHDDDDDEEEADDMKEGEGGGRRGKKEEREREEEDNEKDEDGEEQLSQCLIFLKPRTPPALPKSSASMKSRLASFATDSPTAMQKADKNVNAAQMTARRKLSPRLCGCRNLVFVGSRYFSASFVCTIRLKTKKECAETGMGVVGGDRQDRPWRFSRI